MRAVASVIANRVRQMEGEYGRQNSVNDVAFAGRQFECITNPRQNIYLMSPNAQHYDIAQWALDGGTLNAIENALWFYAPYEAPCRTMFPNQNGRLVNRIGGHCFYVPTASYINT